MKKITILAAGLVCLLAAGCTKEIRTFNMFALNDISFNDNDSKMHLSYHSNLSALSYDSGEDHVYVNGVDFTIYQRGSDRNSWTAESSTTISADNFYSVYVDGTVNSYNDASHSYNFNMTTQLSTTTGVILYGSTTDHCLTLTPACCIIRLPLGAAGYTAKIGFTDGRIVKEGSINVSTGTITPTGYLTGISNPSPGVYAGQFLNMKMDADNNYYIAVPLAGNSANTKLYIEWTYGGGSPIRYATVGEVTLERGYVYTVGTSRVSPFEASGKGIGKFWTAGPSVAFSKGNLLYNGDNNLFCFADNQYQSQGSMNNNIDRRYDGFIDLFGWGTSGQDKYFPYLSSTSAAAYYSAGNIEGLNYDWGVKNSANIRTNTSLTTTTTVSWHALSEADWNEILDNHRWGLATIRVNSVPYYGLLICPKTVKNPNTGIYATWTDPTGNFHNGMASGFSTNNITDESVWRQLENSGVIFLPITGYRSGTSTRDMSFTGWYWSTTNGTGNNAKAFTFGDDLPDDVWCETSNQSRFIGCAVRLVTDI